MSPPTLDPLWRTTPDDRDLIRQYAGLSVSYSSLQVITDQMNGVAKLSASSVGRVQRWIDEVESLQADYADQVADGTAHLGNVSSYEGPTPGVKLTKADRQRKLDVLEWDTDLLKVKTSSNGNALSTADGVRRARVAELKDLVLTAVGLTTQESDGTFPVYRS